MKLKAAFKAVYALIILFQFLIPNTVLAQCPQITEIQRGYQCPDYGYYINIVVDKPDGVMYSIDGGQEFVSTSLFTDLIVGDYLIFIATDICSEVFSTQIAEVGVVSELQVSLDVDTSIDTELKLSVESDGYRYSWYKNGKLLSDEDSNTITLYSWDESAEYSVTYIKDSNCVYSNSFAFDNGTVATSPAYLIATGSICRRLDLDIDYDGATNIQWFRNGQALVGETGMRLVVSMWDDEPEGFYSATFSTPDGDKETGTYQALITYHETHLEIAICQGESISVTPLGIVVDQPGLYTFKTSASDGCDSTIRMVVVWDYSLACEENTFSGIVYYDANENGIKDADEQGIEGASVNIVSHGLKLIVSENGKYLVRGVEGDNYEISLDLDGDFMDKWLLTSSTSVYNLDFEIGNPSNHNFDFGLVLKEPKYEGKLTVSPPFPRCNTTNTLYVQFSNLGLPVEINDQVIVEIELDSKFEFVSTNYPDYNYANNIVSFELSDIEFFETRKIEMVVQMPDEQATGESFTIESKATLISAGLETILDQQSYLDVVRCSYDPNDKQVSPKGEGPDMNTNLDQVLTYTVRFQNTGNDTAYTVRIKDVLDPNLELETFKIVNSSHEMITSIEDREVEFIFEDIYLVDSLTNEELSQGFVTYEIAPIAGVAENTVIENTASIFFDSNPAIVTNTTTNTLVDMEAEPSSILEVDNNEFKVELFPNPIHEGQSLSIRSYTNDDLNLTLLDQLGRTVLSSCLVGGSGTIPIGSLQEGVYFCVLQNSSFKASHKLFVK